MAPRKSQSSTVNLTDSGAVAVVGDISKASNQDQAVSRLKLSESGTVGLVQMQFAMDRLEPVELRWPRVIDTITKMSNDADVAAGLNASVTTIEKSFSTWSVSVGKSNSQVAKEAAEFIWWNFNNLDNKQTLRKIARAVAKEFLRFGFAITEKPYTQITSGKYNGKYKLKYLGTRPVASLDTGSVFPFDVSEDGRTILAVRQNSAYFMGLDSNTSLTMQSYGDPITIERKKFVLFGVGATDAQPRGESPLKPVWRPWREKCLIENQEVVGVSKDLSGKRLASH